MNRRPCKFGDNCRDLTNGNCKFSHSPNMGGGGRGPPRNNNGGGGFINPNPNFGYPNKVQNANYNQPFIKGNQQGFNNQYNPRNNFNERQNNHYNQPNNNYNQPNNYPNNNQPKYPVDQYTAKFCRNFQLGQQCKYGQKCSRLHKFTQNDNIRRLSILHQVPTHKQSNLSSFLSQGKRIYSLRNGNEVTFFQYQPLNGTIIPSQFKWNLPSIEINYYYFLHRQNYIYYAYQNPLNGLHSFGSYNLLNQQVLGVEGAHQNFITGVTHLFQNMVLTSSLDGTLRLWKLEANKLLLDNASTQVLFKHYNKGNSQLKIELIFMHHTDIEGTRLIAVGTNDNRLLFWIGNQMNYQQVVLNPQFTNVISVRYFSYGGTRCAMIAAWNKDNTASALFAMNLNSFQLNKVMELKAPPETPRANITVFECLGDLLLVGNGFGLLSLYKIPEFNTKIGVIMHNNSLSDILAVENLTSNNIVTRNIFILQKIANKEGSLAVYLYKP